MLKSKTTKYVLASLNTNFRYTVYNALINFGYIWMNFGEFFASILVYHYPPWPTQGMEGECGEIYKIRITPAKPHEPTQ